MPKRDEPAEAGSFAEKVLGNVLAAGKVLGKSAATKVLEREAS